MTNNPKDSLVGTRVREYEILDVIGKGGMGAVYRARHVYLDEERAIKVILAPLADQDSPFIDRFIREAKILTKLRHPDLVELYEFGRLDETMLFMVLELMRGESVQARIQRIGRIPLADSLRIVREAANGLHVAHERGIIHRDISPDNLMLVRLNDGTEITKVIDFGIAKPTFQETRQYTIGQMFMGKPQFSSPEQCGFHEEGEEIDGRSDIYSLAITLYYMLSSKLPFYSATPQGYLVKHAHEPPKPISSHFAPGELPDAVEKLISKALSKKRDERQSSMAEFAEEIDRIQNPAPPVELMPTQVVTAELKIDLLFAQRYEIKKKLGRDEKGILYKAIDTFLNIPVALKTMKPEIAGDPITYNRLRKEVLFARKISHPNICRIYDIGENSGIYYLSMELIEGSPLSEILKQGAMALSPALSTILQVLDGMEAAHTAGVLHRNLKPQNIIFDLEGIAHITDFGISTSTDASRMTEAGGVIGTPRYMAPELITAGKVDHRADIYSIGAILFELVTGAFLFEADTPATILYDQVHTPPRRPTQLVSGFPQALENIILKALEKDPEYRFQSTTEFRNAVNDFLQTASGSSIGVADSAQSAPPITRTDEDESETVLLRADSISDTSRRRSPTQVPPAIPTGVGIGSPAGSSAPIATEVSADGMTALDRPSASKKMLLIMGALVAVLVIAGLIWLLVGLKTSSTKTAEPAGGQMQQPAAEEATKPVPPSLEQKAEAEKHPAETPKIETSAPDSGVEEYTVEVMATSWKSRAEERIAELNQKGYSAFLGDNGEATNRYRVRVGRFKDYPTANEMLTRLKDDLQINPWIATIPKSSSSETE